MNAAVQILIQRMQTHPEDFFMPPDHSMQRGAFRANADTPKFRHIAVQIERHIIGAKDRDESSADPLWHLTAAEREALRVAFTEARRVQFDAEVIHTLMAQPEHEPEVMRKTLLTPRVVAQQALGILEGQLAKNSSYKDRNGIS